MWAFREAGFFDILEEYCNFLIAYEQKTGYRCDLPSVGYAISRDTEALLSYSWESATLSIDPASTGGPEWEKFLHYYNEFCSARRGVPLFNQTPFLTRDQVRKAFGVRLQQFAARRKAADPKDRLLDGGGPADSRVADLSRQVRVAEPIDKGHDARVFPDPGVAQRLELLEQDRVEPRRSVAFTGQPPHPDAVCDQEMIERAVHRLEERPAVRAVIRIGQARSNIVDARVAPRIVARHHGKVRLHGEPLPCLHTLRVMGRRRVSVKVLPSPLPAMAGLGPANPMR
jgi:hypothetical protein